MAEQAASPEGLMKKEDVEPSLWDKTEDFLWYSPVEKWKWWKRLLNLPFGFALGCLLFWWLFSGKVELIVGNDTTKMLVFQWGTTGVLAFAFAWTPAVRAIVWITIFELFGNHGLLTLRTVIWFLLLGRYGPVMNTIDNGKLLAESLECNLHVAANVTMARLQWQTAPAKHLIVDLTAGSYEARKVFGSLQTMINPMLQQIGYTGEEEVSKEEAKMASKQAREDLMKLLREKKHQHMEQWANFKRHMNRNHFVPPGMRKQAFSAMSNIEEKVRKAVAKNGAELADIAEGEKVVYGEQRGFLRQSSRTLARKAAEIVRKRKVGKQEKAKFEELLKENEDAYNQTFTNVRLKNSFVGDFLDMTTLRCDEVYNHAYELCNDYFGGLHERCVSFTYQNLWNWVAKIVNKVICIVFKLTYFCDLLKFISVRNVKCNVREFLNDTLLFSDAFEVASKALKAIKREFDFDITFEMRLPNRLKVVKSLKQFTIIFLTAKKEVESYTEVVLLVFQGIGMMILGLGLFKSYRYVNGYLNDFNHDNFWLTRHYKKIDKERREKKESDPEAWKHMVVLGYPPTKKLEQKLYIRYSQWRLPEKGKFITAFFTAVFHLAVLLFFWYFDRTVTEILCVVRRQDTVKVDQHGINRLHFTINGSGYLAQMAHSVLDSFANQSFELHQQINNSHCKLNVKEFNRAYPDPLDLRNSCYESDAFNFLTWILETDEGWWWLWISLLLFVMIIYGFIQSWVLRVRWMICGMFFRQRQRKRIVWLYNEMQKRRLRAVFYAKENLKKQLRDGLPVEEFGFWHVCYTVLPYDFIKKRLNICLICREKLNISNAVEMHQVTPLNRLEYFELPKKCDKDHYYCHPCFEDMQTQRKEEDPDPFCIGCRAREEFEAGN